MRAYGPGYWSEHPTYERTLRAIAEHATITVLIPTYRRPNDLGRCLGALEDQVRVPDEILVVVRDDDTETQDLLASSAPKSTVLRTVSVGTRGTVAALNAGLEAARGDIISFTNDDAAPHPDWLARVEEHFRTDPKLGGVGGRDWVRYGDRINDGTREVVGKVRWFGRTIADHHLGAGEPREVDILKGVNMSYRRAAIRDVRFDERLLLAGGVHPMEDYLFSMETKRAGWKILYDPAVAVDHHQAQRLEGHRSFKAGQQLFDSTTVTNRVHNHTLMLLESFSPLRRLAFMFWAFLVGSRNAFGLLQWLRFLPGEGRLAWDKLRASWKGRLKGYKTWRRGS